MLREIKIDLQYQPTIPGPPPQEGNLYQRACNGDEKTVSHWRDTWIKNYQAAKDHFGDFGSKSMGLLYGANRHKPAIVIGSGPSLKHSIKALKENAESKFPVMTVSCMHNFGLFEDSGFHADYYLSLDAGDIVFDDMSEGCKEKAGYYWEKTKGKTLVAYAASPPELWTKWQGDVYLFNTLMPDPEVRKIKEGIAKFTSYISCGGNALGGCMYVAKALMGSAEIMYVGADFCFDYDDTFHSYKTKYDDPGTYIRAVDVFGNMRKTWQSYMNFKFWFDHIACNVPGSWVNCSEGLMGAYRDGNIAQFKYMPLEKALIPYQSADTLFIEERDASGKITGNRTPLSVGDYWANPLNERDFTFF
jgi:hypothetical protein